MKKSKTRAHIVALILARGGSKGIPKKNIIDFCGKPLIAWTIEQAKRSKEISSVWVSSDDPKILKIAEKFGAKPIIRPNPLASDTASSAPGFLHALDKIEESTGSVDIVVALQATSPVRETSDIDLGLKIFKEQGYDSMFSSTKFGDSYVWEKDQNGKLRSINYDYQNRKRRQDVAEQFLENGSFYIFKPKILRKNNNFLGGKLGTVTMEFWKSFEIDDYDDLSMCELMMKSHLLKTENNKKTNKIIKSHESGK